MPRNRPRRLVNSPRLSWWAASLPQKSSPASGRSSPASRLSNVLLPEPDSPRIETLSPAPIERLTSSRTPSVRSPLGYVLRRPLARRTEADSLTAQRLHGFETRRTPRGDQAGEGRGDHRENDDPHHRLDGGVSREVRKLVRAHERILPHSQMGDHADYIVSIVQQSESEGQSKRDAGDTEHDALDAKTPRNVASTAPH